MLYIVINKYSGSFSERKLQSLRKAAASYFKDVIISETVSRQGKITLDIDPENIKADDIIAAAGGDGTINICLQYIHDNSLQETVLLGIIPLGTGNNMIRSLKLSKNIDSSFQILRKCSIENISYGTINGEKAFFNCSIGFSSYVLKNRKTNSLTGYYYDAVRLYPGYKGCRLSISGSDKDIDLFAGFFINTKVYMSKFRFLKENNSDKQLDFFYLEKGNIIITPAKAAMAFLNPDSYKKVTDEKITIKLDKDCDIETDGDIFSITGQDRTAVIENHSYISVITNNKYKDKQ